MKYLYAFIIISVMVIISLVKINNTKNNTINEITNTTPNTVSKKEYKIVAFGDSLTAGYGVDLKDSYPSILEEKLNTENEKILKEKNIKITVVNMGVSGETTSGGLERVDFVISQKPKLVLLGLGGNDMLRATNPSLIKDNLNNIIKSLTDKNIKVILLGMESQVSNGLEYRKEFGNTYKDLSKKYDLPLVPFFLKGVALVSSLNIEDGIHPNRAGYEKIIDENILPILLPVLEDALY